MHETPAEEPRSLSPRLREWRDAGAFVQHGGHRLYYRAEGRGDPLLLLHGYPTASWGWHRMWDELTHSRLVVALDLLGSGFSDKPVRGPYRVASLADQCETVLDALNVSGVDVLAHAYGVSPAQELLARQTEDGRARAFRVRSVSFISGALFPAEVEPTPMQRVLTGPLGPLVATLTPYARSRFCRNLADTFGPNTRPTAAELAEFWQLLRYNEGHRATPWVMQYLHDRKRRQERLVGAMQNASIPLQLIHTAGDPIIGGRILEPWLRTVPHGECTEISGDIGHYAPLEAPREVLDAFLAFQCPHLERTRANETADR